MKFDLEEASLLLQKEKWDELLIYLGKFVDSDSHDGSISSHPGLVFIVVEQNVLQLMRRGSFDEAKKVFDEKVHPLLDVADKTFFPLDLDDHIKGLQNHVMNRKLPEGENPSYTTDSRTAFFDYISLYFPHSRQLSEHWEGNMQEFVDLYFDGTILHHRCRACQWILPTGHGLSNMMAHLVHRKSKPPVKLCSSLTLNLWKRLNVFQNQKNTEEQLSFEAFRVKYKVRTGLQDQIKKRKGEDETVSGSQNKKSANLPLTEVPAASVSVEDEASVSPGGTLVSKAPKQQSNGAENPAGASIFALFRELANKNFLILQYFHEGSSQLADQVREVCKIQNSVIQEMLNAYMCRQEIDENTLFANAMTMQQCSERLMRPIVRRLPPFAQDFALQLDDSIAKLRSRTFLGPPPAGEVPGGNDTGTPGGNDTEVSTGSN